MKPSQNIDELIIEHMNYLYRIAFRLTGCSYSSEDIVQDLFVNLSPKDIDSKTLKNPRAWLATILYRTFIKHHRREKRSPISRHNTVFVNENNAFMDEIASSSPGPAELAEQSRLQTQLMNAVYSLNEKYRTVVVLHDVEGYTLQELQQITDTPLGTLKSRLHRARLKLQVILQQEEETSDSPQYQGVSHEV